MELQLENIGITKDFLNTIESEYRIFWKRIALRDTSAPWVRRIQSNCETEFIRQDCKDARLQGSCRDLNLKDITAGEVVAS